MAWIESHQELARHPKTRKLARILGVSIPTVIGHLHLLWWWAMDYAQEGTLERYDDSDIADAAMWEGDPAQFLDALYTAGFIDQDEHGVFSIHDWHDYAGRLLEKRRADAERKRSTRYRPMDVQRTSSGCPTDGAGNLTVPNLTVPNQTKHNQTVKVDTHAPGDAVCDPAPAEKPISGGAQHDEAKAGSAGKGEEYTQGFETFWQLYPRRREKRRAWRAWQARMREKEDPENLILAASHYATACVGKEERFIKLPATFLGPDKPYEEYINGPPKAEKVKRPSMAEKYGVEEVDYNALINV